MTITEVDAVEFQAPEYTPNSDSDTRVEAPQADTEAPYGRKADGTPRAKPGRKPGANGQGTRAPRAPGPKRASGSSRSQYSTVDYRPAIEGILQMVSFPLAIVGRSDKSFALDAAAVTLHTPNIADALNQIAQETPAVAVVLDKLMSVGPYGLLIAAVVPLIAQIAANHKAVPVDALAPLGVMDEETLLAAMQNTQSVRR